MVIFLQIGNKGYLDILNPNVSEMVMSAEGRFESALVLIESLTKSIIKELRFSKQVNCIQNLGNFVPIPSIHLLLTQLNILQLKNRRKMKCENQKVKIFNVLLLIFFF